MDIQNLTGLFNCRLFRIPDYQRGYAWGDEELDDFWSDLVRATSEKRHHFCNQIMLQEVKGDALTRWPESDRALLEEASFQPFYVVDGQQRLTTSLILIQSLLEKLPDNQSFAGDTIAEKRSRFLVKGTGMLRHPLFGYIDQGSSHQCYVVRILGETSQGDKKERTLYTANMEYALAFFRKKIAGAVLLQREEWMRTLTQRFLVNVAVLPEKVDEFVAFETMNYRGKDLSCLELLKNRLIFLATILLGHTPAERNQLRRDIGSVWSLIYATLGREPDWPLDDDEFLRAHRIAYFQEAEDDSVEKFLLGKIFTTTAADAGLVTYETIADYISSLRISVDCWHRLNHPARRCGDLCGEEIGALDRLHRLDWSVLQPLLLATLVKVGPLHERQQIYEQAERFLFLVRACTYTKNHVARPESYRSAHQLFVGAATPQTIAANLAQRVQRHFSADKFQMVIDDLFWPDEGEGFYGWRALHFFLFEYEEFCRREARDDRGKIVSWEKFKGSWETIEHVYPQDALDADWPDFSQFDPVTKRHLMHSLGNLVAISHSKNASLKRAAFDVKVNGNGSGISFRVGSFSENKIALNMDEAGKPLWTEKQIQERGLELLEFIETRWDVSIGDESSKLKLLKADVWAPPPNLQP